ncbi:MAG: septal ring lytic transglycosylase RlpA family protein [Parvularculaceae bacterium]|nr:septal ring lytic transglycosylase RlpA family protein [Parvularculaceae bacterium]
MPTPQRQGRRSRPQVTSRFSGRASYYAASLHGNLTASGEVYLDEKLTAAHKTLPFGTQVLVTRRDTGQVVMVTINDRGPFVGDRVIDLSGAAADILGMRSAGVVWVDVEVLGN